jgi:hypothetical protein
MTQPGIFTTLLSGMSHGYRRWMTLSNTASIGFSVILTLVILSFTHGIRTTIHDIVRKEAAAGAVRIHFSGWRPDAGEQSFADAVRDADRELRERGPHGGYTGFNFWWRSEAHAFSPVHPGDTELRGIFAKLGNTFPEDPEATRVAPYALAGKWVRSADAEEIVLDAEAARKLVRRMPGVDAVEALVGRAIWITLPPTSDHLPAACAQVTVAGIFEYLRDQACMTTPAVIQQMYARTRANANARWDQTYDRLAYRIDGGPMDGAPLLCWRIRDPTTRWIHARTPNAPTPDPALPLAARPEGLAETLAVDAPLLPEPLPPSERMSLADLDQRFPGGYVLCSPRVWDDLGYQAAPLYPVESWRDAAIYAYLYFQRLDDASSARELLQARGFETYMPIDRFQGLLGLVRVVTGGAMVLLATVLLAGLFGIMVTLYSEVDAEEAEIGLLKALGASNAAVGAVYLGKGALIGLAGAAIGVPLAAALGGRLNQLLARAVAQTSGLDTLETGLFRMPVGMIAAVAAAVVALAALAALLPALQAAAKDPQEALRAE